MFKQYFKKIPVLQSMQTLLPSRPGRVEGAWGHGTTRCPHRGDPTGQGCASPSPSRGRGGPGTAEPGLLPLRGVRGGTRLQLKGRTLPAIPPAAATAQVSEDRCWSSVPRPSCCLTWSEAACICLFCLFQELAQHRDCTRCCYSCW